MINKAQTYINNPTYSVLSGKLLEYLGWYIRELWGIKMMSTTKYILILILIISCRTIEKTPINNPIPKYVITSYYNNPDEPKNFFSAKYYDSSDNLIREIGRDGDCERYIYDTNGVLIETIWGRTCDNGVRKIFIFDSLGNHIGYYRTFDTLVNLDTVPFEQIKFYDSQNRLIKEKVNERKSSEGDTIKTWNYYSYDGAIKTSVVIKENNITIWNGTYKYDSVGRLTELKKIRKRVFEIEYYIYDSIGRIIEKGTKSNGKLITEMGTYEIPDRKRIYSFDSTGFAFKETLYQDDKVELRVFNIKTYNNNAP